MIFLFEVLCLFFTLYTLHTYVVTETHSRTHRLLPLVMGLIGVYNFYQIVMLVTDDNYIFTVLKDFLIIYIIYFLIFYMFDFLHIQIYPWHGRMLFISLALVNGEMIWLAFKGRDYTGCFMLGFCLFYAVVIVITIYANVWIAFSERERFVDRLLFAALFLPCISIFSRFVELPMLKKIAMPGALLVSCAIILYLIKTGQLVDTTSFLHENLFDKSDVPILLFDNDFFYLDANESAKEMFPELKNITRKRKNSHRFSRVYELSTMPEKTVEIKWNDKYYKCVLDEQFEGEKQKGYVISVFNITKQKEEIHLMEALKKEAEYQSNTKSRFLARMSHDMRSPMHAIIEVSDMLSQKSDISEHNKALLAHVKNAGDMLLELINSMLEFSKIEDGKLSLNEREYHFEHMIENISNLSVMNLSSKPVHFIARIEGEHPQRLFGDDIRVREVFHNILSNAVKFTNKGEISCNITLEMCEDESVRITCVVKDTGFGMTREQIQGAAMNTDDYLIEKKREGYGLGLSIVKKIVGMLDGNIQFESDVSSGSKVTVIFYQKKVDNTLCPEVIFTTESILEKEALDRDSLYPDYVYPKARILVADDMRINREIFREEVSHWKCELDCVADGVLAVEAAEQKKYHMIFLDQMMPNMTGIETAKIIKEIQPDAAIIMMTGDAQTDLWEDAKRAGVDDYLAKPYDMTELQRLLEKYMPMELREIPDEGKQSEISSYITDQNVYRKVLKTFIDEIEDFEQHMKDYVKNDMEIFRIKVHGVKGVCKQLNKRKTAEAAEIMEMAAKTDNMSFISDHLEQFQNEVTLLLKQMKVEWSKMADDSSGQDNTWGEMTVKQMWQQLKEGFDEYNLDQIDIMLKKLSDSELSSREYEVLNKAEYFFDELEYEEGSELLESFLNNIV